MDYNKLWSLINKEGLSKSAAAKIAGMTHQGFVYMMERQTMTVGSLEKFADHFNIPISNFFEIDETILQVTEPNTKYEKLLKCKDCIEKDRTIDALKQTIETQEKLINVLFEKKNRKDGTSG